jgi:hypothetical protein
MSLLILGEIGRFMCAFIQSEYLTIIYTLLAICPLSKRSSITLSSFLLRIKKMLGRQQRSLLVSHFSSLFSIKTHHA